MTKQEIQTLIDAKIAGQGSAVDVGGALPKILTEILNAAFAGANVQSDWDENDNTDPSFIKNKPTVAEIVVYNALMIDVSTGYIGVESQSVIDQMYDDYYAGKIVRIVMVSGGTTYPKNAEVVFAEIENSVKSVSAAVGTKVVKVAID